MNKQKVNRAINEIEEAVSGLFVDEEKVYEIANSLSEKERQAVAKEWDKRGGTTLKETLEVKVGKKKNILLKGNERYQQMGKEMVSAFYPTNGSGNTRKYIIIGGAVVVLSIIGYFILRKKK